MSTFCSVRVRGIPAHRRPLFVNISGCESSQCRIAQQCIIYRFYSHPLNRPAPFSTSCSCDSYSRHSYTKSANGFTITGLGSRLKRITRPQQSVNMVLHKVHLSTWIKTRIDDILYQLRNVSERIPGHLVYRLRKIISRGNDTADSIDERKSGLTTQMLIEEKTSSEKQSIGKKSTKQDFNLKGKHDQYALQKAKASIDQNVVSSRQSSNRLAIKDQSQPENYPKEEVGWNIFRKFQLPSQDRSSSPEKKQVSQVSSATGTVPEKHAICNKGAEPDLSTKQELKFEDNLKQHTLEKATHYTNRCISLQTPAPSQHHATKDKVKPRISIDEEEEGWNVFRTFSIPFKDSPGPPKKSADLPVTESKSEKQSAESKDVERESIFKGKSELIRKKPRNYKSQYISSHDYALKSSKHLATTDKVQPETFTQDEEMNWSMFKKLSVPFTGSTSGSEKKSSNQVSPAMETKFEKPSSESKVGEQESCSEDNTEDTSEKPRGDTNQSISSHEHTLMSAKHLTAKDKLPPKVLAEEEEVSWNVFRKLSLPFSSGVAETKSEKQTVDSKGSLQEPSFEHNYEQRTLKETIENTNESISSYHSSKSDKYPETIRKIQPKGSTEDEDAGWNVFRKFSLPFPGSFSTPKKPTVIRKGFVSRSAIEERTRLLVNNIKSAKTYSSKMTRLKDLCRHIKQFPSCRHEATECKAVPLLLRIVESSDNDMKEEAREALALLGYNAPVRGRGIRILCLDGGGTRGLVTIQCLKQLEQFTDRKIHEVFDYVCGVSTGALLAAIVFLYHIPLEECERLYEHFSREMFNRSRVIGTGGLVWNQAFYDSVQWEKILQSEVGRKTMIEFARDPVVPKVAAVSTLMNTPRMENYVFRNYNFPPSVYSHYTGDCTHELWEVIRASSAAPGYYEDFTLGIYVHSDGGLTANNPTALAIHESHLLWPHEKIQCVVSLGTGRYEPIQELTSTRKVTLKEKISKLVDNTTDTEAIHIMMTDVMPPATYFRFNPYLSEDVPLDEIQQDRLNSMKRDTTMYLRKNELKMRKAADTLTQGRHFHQKAMDWIRLKSETLP